MLDGGQVAVEETRLSKKQPLSEADVVALLSSVDEVILARGKTVRKLAAKEAAPDDLRGPSGGFRAPMLKVGTRLLVGFHEAQLKEILG